MVALGPVSGRLCHRVYDNRHRAIWVFGRGVNRRGSGEGILQMPINNIKKAQVKDEFNCDIKQPPPGDWDVGRWHVNDHCDCGHVLVPTEQTMGDAQRVMYVHISVAWLALMGFIAMSACGLGYLLSRNLWWDQWSQAISEVGWLCSTLTLVTGSLWAHAAWGTWWTWDPRLVTSFILWAFYSGNLILRSGLEDAHQRAAFGRSTGHHRCGGRPAGSDGHSLVSWDTSRFAANGTVHAICAFGQCHRFHGDHDMVAC